MAPAELQAIIMKHPDVDDVGVVGIKDLEAGELLMYLIRWWDSNIIHIKN